ncbi:MAG: DUF4129 domain-containing protein [Mycobacterium sp.]|nr:DUF4129 domain-containing protein [Mycobacterium sp.]
MALQGRIPGPGAPAGSGPQESSGDDPASLIGVVALLGVSFVVMAFAMFNRRPPAPKSAPFEIPDFGRSGRGRVSRRALLILIGLVVAWLAVFVAVGQFTLDPDLTEQAAPPTTAAPADDPAGPTRAVRRDKPHSDTYRLLAGATGVLVMMMAVSTVVAAVRNRSTLPPVVLTAGPPPTSPPQVQPLAVAAERGLAEVANLALDPRAAIIACYAAMERALADAPGAVPQASDTPSEVLARAVGNRTISTRSAAALVDLFAEARFSRHTMTEEHREQAQQALRSVLDEVRASA